MKRHFTITSRNDSLPAVTALADSYEHAAQIGARRLHGRKRGLLAIRVTGDAGLSGYFQAYVPCPTGGQTSWGRNFHVMVCA